MIPSSIIFENGRAYLVINGKREAACAYITYFDERSCCSDFAANGYEIFSLCAYFSGLPLNSIAVGFSPMPGWWIEEHPKEVCTCTEGHKREALFLDAFRETCAAMMQEFIAHVHASDYADHIIGYQIAGGCTGDVIYHGNGYLSIHAATVGTKTIALSMPAVVTPTAPGDGEIGTPDVIRVDMKQFETRMYRILLENQKCC